MTGNRAADKGPSNQGFSRPGQGERGIPVGSLEKEGRNYVELLDIAVTVGAMIRYRWVDNLLPLSRCSLASVAVILACNRGDNVLILI